MAKTTSPIRQAADRADNVPTRVLVLGMVDEHGVIAADELYAVADACGQSQEQVRSCIRRLVADGLFVQTGRGTQARYSATASGLSELGSTMERTRLAYAQDAVGSGWDRRWRLVGFAVPESRRTARDTLRDHLVALGGAAVQGGLYISPHPWLKDVRDEAERLGLGDVVTLSVTDELEVGGERDPRQIVRRLWALDELADRYARFARQFEPMLGALKDLDRREERLADTTFLPGAFSMAVAFQACFESDPLLPPELLPRPWPGRAARDLVIKSRRMALSLREKQGKPPLFRLFDEALEVLK